MELSELSEKEKLLLKQEIREEMAEQKFQKQKYNHVKILRQSVLMLALAHLLYLSARFIVFFRPFDITIGNDILMGIFIISLLLILAVIIAIVTTKFDTSDEY